MKIRFGSIWARIEKLVSVHFTNEIQNVFRIGSECLRIALINAIRRLKWNPKYQLLILQKLFCSNGLLDPWSSGGIFRNISSSTVAIIIPEGAHHLDLRGHNPKDPFSVVQARNFEKYSIKKWIKHYRQKIWKLACILFIIQKVQHVYYFHLNLTVSPLFIRNLPLSVWIILLKLIILWVQFFIISYNFPGESIGLEFNLSESEPISVSEPFGINPKNVLYLVW